MREPGGNGLHIRRAADLVGIHSRAYFPRGYDGRGPEFPAPLRSPHDRFPAGPLARSGPAGTFHDALLPSGRLPHPIPGRDGGGRQNENWLLEDVGNSEVLQYIGATSSGRVLGGNKKPGQRYADASRLPLSPSLTNMSQYVRGRDEANVKKVK